VPPGMNDVVHLIDLKLSTTLLFSGQKRRLRRGIEEVVVLHVVESKGSLLKEYKDA